MNNTPVMAAALMWLALPAAAQLPGGGGLESLPGAIHENIESRIENRIERNRERAQSRAEQALERQREGLASELEHASQAVLAGQLPDLLPTLPILNAQGQTVLTEVQLANGWRAVEREWL
ncbi:MAG: hypothetical protein HKO71_05835, partial [Pseudomonadales bacterium]|nr:hypothetical protein [Pseudomonadales bacterium]